MQANDPQLRRHPGASEATASAPFTRVGKVDGGNGGHCGVMARAAARVQGQGPLMLFVATTLHLPIKLLNYNTASCSPRRGPPNCLPTDRAFAPVRLRIGGPHCPARARGPIHPAGQFTPLRRRVKLTCCHV